LSNSLKWKIFWADLNPVQGSEQAGMRPVLVFSVDVINDVLPVVTVLPITSLKPGRQIYPTEAKLIASENDLQYDSIVMAHQIRALSKSRLNGQCGEVVLPSVKASIEQAIRIYLGL